MGLQLQGHVPCGGLLPLHVPWDRIVLISIVIAVTEQRVAFDAFEPLPEGDLSDEVGVVLLLLGDLVLPVGARPIPQRRHRREHQVSLLHQLLGLLISWNLHLEQVQRLLSVVFLVEVVDVVQELLHLFPTDLLLRLLLQNLLNFGVCFVPHTRQYLPDHLDVLFPCHGFWEVEVEGLEALLHQYLVMQGHDIPQHPLHLLILLFAFKPLFQNDLVDLVLLADLLVFLGSEALDGFFHVHELSRCEAVLLLQVQDHIVVEHIPTRILQVHIIQQVVENGVCVDLGVVLLLHGVPGEEVDPCPHYHSSNSH
eukprot:CAMPEP_0170553170 /NCGR_PEP_ID=MMETSP0211-20121228/10987_1 /TAXON_ID=311385 /ORGANISM="Pseudokeronopsis sp., Strain OXSARD2" /LENGTH=309 /DNA_ID=CAMNT_0010861313 /DNA_START=173 /DNA_END=1099 /DNA_ORIENTATION=-